VGGALARFALCLPIGLVGCATSEDIPDDPVRPGVSGGSSGAGGSGGSSAGGSGAATATGGAGGSVGGAGVGGDGGIGGSSDGSAGSAGAPGAGGCAAGTLAQGELFFDDFECGADQWVAVPADGWSIVEDASQVYQQGIPDSEFRVSAAGDENWTDQVVEAKVKVLAFTGQSTSYLAGVYARFKDLDNHYYVGLQSNGELKIKKKFAGSNTSISSSAPTAIAVNTWYVVKLEVIGSTLKAYLDGTLVLTVTDTDSVIDRGGIALGTKNATAMFDDVKVTIGQ
jgi:hypothetical protein